MKIEKHKCDRCQKEYEPYKSFETETSINEYGMNGIHRKIIDTHYFNRVGLLYADGIYKDCDLCEDCAKALLKWLENETTTDEKVNITEEELRKYAISVNENKNLQKTRTI